MSEETLTQDQKPSKQKKTELKECPKSSNVRDDWYFHHKRLKDCHLISLFQMASGVSNSPKKIDANLSGPREKIWRKFP